MGAKWVVKMNNLSFPLVGLFLCHFSDVASKFCLSCARIGSLNIQVCLIVFLALSNFTDAIGRLIKTHYLPGRSWNYKDSHRKKTRQSALPIPALEAPSLLFRL